MDKWKIGGIILVFISIALSLANILSVNMTGAIVGITVKSSLLTILTFVFFFGGLLFLSNIGNGLAALVIAGSTIAGIKEDSRELTDLIKYWIKQKENTK
jgi:asparagine N-glycosylation enzyme membrane subunit Stt3